MGSYGIGVSRLVGAIIEAKYTNEVMKWPKSVSPFDVVIIPSISKNNKENKLVFLMTVDKARFRNPVIPDCILELNIEAVRSHGKVWKYKGEAIVDGKKMADAQWAATIVDRKK